MEDLLMSDQKVKIGFVGVGSMGQCAHLKNYVTVPDCEVVAIAEMRKNLATRVAQKYGIPKVYSTHEEMFEKEKLDGIVSAQQFTRHGIIVPQLLNAGVPIFTEKPLAGSLQAGEKAVNAMKASGTWHMVGYHKRSDPATMYAKAEIERLKASGELGRLTYVRILHCGGDWVANGFIDLVHSNDPGAQLEWDPPASDMDQNAYNEYVSFVNYWIHQVNLLRHLLGEPYQVKYADPPGRLLIGQSDSGITCTIELSPFRTTVDWVETALVAFEKGYVKIDLPAPLASNRPGNVEIFKDPGDGVTPQKMSPQLPWIHAMRQQAMNFVRAIKGEIKPMCDSVEALEDLKVAREYLKLWRGI
jgi:predicted dehydrogenase